VSRGIGRAAVLIGAITVLARVAGFGRTLVFAHTVGNGCLGTAYATANQVPNIIFDIVAGGALTAVVVPVLAGPAGRARREPMAAADARRTASALLTWTVMLLVPLSVALAVGARPVVSVLLGQPHGCQRAEVTDVATQLLVIFAPQIALYGLAVVLYGILQAHHKFTAPAFAPLLSSLVVSGAYLAFLALGNGYQDRLAGLPTAAELALSVGTTAGVAALVVTVAVPAGRLGLGLRPALRFPRGVAPRVRGLAAAGVAALAAQDAALVAVIVLANSHGGNGSLVLYNYGWQMFFLPYAVLAVPVATSAFPLLSAHAAPRSATDALTARDGGPAAGAADAGLARHAAYPVEAAAGGRAGGAAQSGPGGESPAPAPPMPEAGPAPGAAAPSSGNSASGNSASDNSASAEGAPPGGSFDAVAAASTRAAVLVSFLGAAVLAGAAAPAAGVFVSHQPASARQLAFALVAFAPGLIGYGLVANLGRVLLAAGRSRAAASATVAGWAAVAAADLVVVPLVPRHWVVPALGLGNTVGMTAAGLALLAAAARCRGRACLHGVGRAALAGLAAAAAGGAAGAGMAAGLGGPAGVNGAGAAAGLTVLAGAVAAAAFLAVAYLADSGDLRAATARLRRRTA
jgi:putative peptidoglycan lipid II flippase